MQAVLDIANNKLVFPQKTVNMNIRTMGLPEITINRLSAKMIKVPVDMQNGNVILKRDIKIEDTIIPAGLYEANDGYINAIASNFGDAVTFSWTKPAKTFAIEETVEINNNTSILDQQASFTSTSELESLIRHDHLNQEERQALFKVLHKNGKVKEEDEDNININIINIMQGKRKFPLGYSGPE
ncbi:uncharacterized protein LOC118458957 isoform X2 [Anopheles albimanus]|uniref:uncharacterized protein LOC118458957 isoform X2 n=1 Tax=Anopheles albimanus TaxID=7167 RepID=UPI001641AD62|nr:uncharacterized protein LOC118458957 isoform X2 [Anopheles albimanus]